MKQCNGLSRCRVLHSQDHFKRFNTRISEKVNESSKWYARICRKQGIAKSKALSSSLTVAFLWWQQNSQTDHYPGEREFKVTIGDFIALPSAVFMIARALLEAGLEKEGKSKTSTLNTPTRPAAQWGLWSATLGGTLLSRIQAGAALSWCCKKQVCILPHPCSLVMASMETQGERQGIQFGQNFEFLSKFFHFLHISA